MNRRMQSLVFHPLALTPELFGFVAENPQVVDAMRAHPMKFLRDLVPSLDGSVWWRGHREHAVPEVVWTSAAHAVRLVRPEATELLDALNPACSSLSAEVRALTGQATYRLVPAASVLRLAEVLTSIKPQELAPYLDDIGLAAFRKLAKKADDWRVHEVSLVIFIRTSAEVDAPQLLPAAQLALALIRMRAAGMQRGEDTEGAVRIGAPASPAVREKIVALLGGRSPQRLDELLALTVSISGGHPDSDDDVRLDFEWARSGAEEFGLPNTLVLECDETGAVVLELEGDDLYVWRYNFMWAPAFSFTLIARSLGEFLQRSATYFENGGEGPFQQEVKTCRALSRDAAVGKTASYPALSAFVEGLPGNAKVYDLRNKKVPVGFEIDDEMAHRVVHNPGFFRRSNDLVAIVPDL